MNRDRSVRYIRTKLDMATEGYTRQPDDKTLFAELNAIVELLKVMDRNDGELVNETPRVDWPWDGPEGE